LGEFYCFTGIISGYLSDDRELNPLNGKSLSDEFPSHQDVSHDVKRKKAIFSGCGNTSMKTIMRSEADRFISTTKKSSTRISQNRMVFAETPLTST